MSFLPGLDENEKIDFLGDANEVHNLRIPQGSQWKIKVPHETKMTIKILDGIGEVFGTELANDIEYVFQDWAFSVYAVEEINLEWKCAGLPTSDLDIEPNLTANQVYNLHFALEKLRNSSFDGPKVLVVGGTNTGKTALCRTLASYTIKFKTYQPLFINLNPNEGIFSPPGCLTATPISDLLDPQSAVWGQSMTSGATALHNKQPLVVSYGLEAIGENRELYKESILKLVSGVKERQSNDPLVRRSGCIIDTPPISHFDDSVDELETIVSSLNVNVVIVLANEDDNDLFEKVKTKLHQSIGDFILRLPPLSGVIKVDDVYRRAMQRSAIREYFYGDHNTVLSPYTCGVDYEELQVWKPKNLLDVMEQNMDRSTPTELVPVPIDPSNLQHSVVAITYANKKASPKEVKDSSILGFALITEINEKRRKLRILLPVPGRFPNNAVILTSLRYLE